MQLAAAPLGLCCDMAGMDMDPAAATECPGSGDGDAACAMMGHHHEAADQSMAETCDRNAGPDGTSGQCAMRSTCIPPAALLLSLAADPGILPDTSAAPLIAQSTPIAGTSASRASAVTLPDAPPPRD
jgi:hypothetical protein